MRFTLIVALLAGVLGAPDAEPKRISVDLDDVTLAALARAVSEQAGVVVRVSDEVAGRRVTLALEKVTAEEVLKQAAARAETTLTESADGSFRLGPEKPTIEARIRKTLAEAKLNVNFQGTHLTEALDFYANMTGVTMVLDPHVLATREAGTLEMNLAVQAIAADKLLALTSQLLDLTWDVRWGLVLVSTKERLAALPTFALPPTPAGERPLGETHLRRRLGEETIGFAFAETPLPTAILFLEKLWRLPIRWDAGVRETAEKMPVTLRLSNTPAGGALAVLLYPRGLEFEVTAEAIVIRSVKR